MKNPVIALNSNNLSINNSILSYVNYYLHDFVSVLINGSKKRNYSLLRCCAILFNPVWIQRLKVTVSKLIVSMLMLHDNPLLIILMYSSSGNKLVKETHKRTGSSFLPCVVSRDQSNFRNVFSLLRTDQCLTRSINWCMYVLSVREHRMYILTLTC